MMALLHGRQRTIVKTIVSFFRDRTLGISEKQPKMIVVTLMTFHVGGAHLWKPKLITTM
jgi:hypothetical protein